nr:nucleotide-binding alpha-beta plait domain-containing protein [Tanacetum cinerariifolium]
MNKPTVVGARIPASHSFKDAAAGPAPKVRNIMIDEDKNIRSVLECCWMGKAKNLQVLQNVWDIIENNGLINYKVKYYGGLSFLFEWSSKDAAKVCIEENNILLEQWFDNIKPWEEDNDVGLCILEIRKLDFNSKLLMPIKILKIVPSMMEILQSILVTLNKFVGFSMAEDGGDGGADGGDGFNGGAGSVALDAWGNVKSHSCLSPASYEVENHNEASSILSSLILFSADSVGLVGRISLDAAFNNLDELVPKLNHLSQNPLDHPIEDLDITKNIREQLGFLFDNLPKTKLESIDDSTIHFLWPNNFAAFVTNGSARASGDLNVVRYQEERSVCRFNRGEADAFYDFIARTCLFDFPLCGRRFTRFDRDGIKASKLDMFLVSHSFFDLRMDAFVSVLTRSYSDHCPIMIKLKNLRIDIKRWTASRLREQNSVRYGLSNNLLEWDKKAKDGLLSDHDIIKTEEWLLDLYQLDQLYREDLKQRGRFRLAVKGDENSKFVHSTLNSRNVHCPVKGVHVDEVWVDSPDNIKVVALIILRLDLRKVITTGPFSITPFSVSFLLWMIVYSNPPFLGKKSRMRFGIVLGLSPSVPTASTLASSNPFGKLLSFGIKWRKWIASCLSSASISVLINGSPSKEFKMECGLRQGDPLSPFLFFLVIEALQVTIVDACNKGIFKGFFGE